MKSQPSLKVHVNTCLFAKNVLVKVAKICLSPTLLLTF